MYSYLSVQFARERQREMRAKAAQQRLAQQAVALARASRRADRAERHLRAAVRKALRLRSELEQ